MITNAIVVACILVLLLSLITVIIRLRLRGHNALSGKPPIPMWALLTGKLSMAITIFMMLASALGLELGPEVPLGLQWVAVVILLAGLGIAIPSLFQLGEELRFGLSEAHTATLKSKGLYRVSRNPLYLGFYLIATASCLYVPTWATLFFAIVAIGIHHQVVLAEEQFLRQRFAGTYNSYTRQVRRYL